MINKKIIHTAILIPLYNDWQSLFDLLNGIDRILSGLNRKTTIYISDDHSSVDYIGFVQKLKKKSFVNIEALKVIRLRRNMGHQGAIAVGICHIVSQKKEDCILIMDADGEDKPEDIPRLLSRMEETGGHSIVFAERRKRNENIFFKMMYRVFQFINYLMTGFQMDIGNFSVISSSVAHSLIAYPELWSHYSATVIKSKTSFVKIPCDRGTRIDGKSKMSMISLVLHGLSCISVFAPVVGARMLLTVSFVLLLFFLGIPVIFWIRFFSDMAIPGWATYTTGILVLFIFQLLGMSFIFVFFILNGKNPSQFLPEHNYKYFTEYYKIIWRK